MQVLSQIHISVSSSGFCIVRLSVAYKSVRYAIVVGKCARPPTSSAQCISIHPFHSNFIDMVGLEPYVSPSLKYTCISPNRTKSELSRLMLALHKGGTQQSCTRCGHGHCRRRRSIFPILSLSGRSVGRGGRWIGDLLTFPALGASFPH